MAKINPFKIVKVDDNFYQIIGYKFTPQDLVKYGKLKEKKGAEDRNFFTDDFYVINKYTVGFKNKIPEFFDPVEFESNILNDKWCPLYTEEFLDQYEIQNNKIIRKDRKVPIDKISWWYFPVLIPLEKLDPNYRDYCDPDDIVKRYGGTLE